jgi:hypothetical protein
LQVQHKENAEKQIQYLVAMEEQQVAKQLQVQYEENAE